MTEGKEYELETMQNKQDVQEPRLSRPMPESNAEFAKRLRTEPYNARCTERVLIIRTKDRDSACDRIEQQQGCIRKLYHAVKVSPNNFPTKADLCNCKSCVNWQKIKSKAIAEAEEQTNG